MLRYGFLVSESICTIEKVHMLTYGSLAWVSIFTKLYMPPHNQLWTWMDREDGV